MYSRRQFLKSAGTSLAALSLLGCSPTQQKTANAQPNILFIVLDDLNDWVGCYGGHPQAKTPNLDRLAREGMMFTHAYCTSPLCGPSRSAFLSGMRASTTGIYDNVTHYHDVIPEVENMPVFFGNHGYRTLGAGKIFHGAYPQYWHEFLERAPRMYQRGEPKKNGTDIPGIFDWGPLDWPDSKMDDYRMAQFAIDKLREDHTDPFFLACGIYLPHVPWYAPQKYFDMHPLDEIQMPVVKEDDLDDIPTEGVRCANLGYTKYVEESGKTREAVQAYLASISFADAQVGRILDALDDSEYKDNTIVVVFGDHGLHLGEKNKWHKDSLWEESTRTPLLISAPGLTPSGSTCQQVVSLIDLYPTLASLAGLQPPDFVEGDDITRLLKNPDTSWDRAAITHRRENQISVRTRRWHYIRYQDGSEELYDHNKDPYEWKNLAKEPQYDTLKKELFQTAAHTVTNAG